MLKLVEKSSGAAYSNQEGAGDARFANTPAEKVGTGYQNEFKAKGGTGAKPDFWKESAAAAPVGTTYKNAYKETGTGAKADFGKTEEGKEQARREAEAKAARDEQSGAAGPGAGDEPGEQKKAS